VPHSLLSPARRPDYRILGTAWLPFSIGAQHYEGHGETGWISFGMSRERLAPLMSDRSVPLDFPPSDIAVCSWSIPRRFVVLDAWRGIAALWVAAYHFRIVGHITQTHFIRSGLVAVDFLLVLSGLVIRHGFCGKQVDRT
jgi:hypothetical protein